MLSVIIPTLNAAETLAPTLTALIPATIEGLVREVIIVDGGSDDETLEIADASGATIVRTERGRGQQLRAGAEVARQPWLLFLHADTVLERDWDTEVRAFAEKVDTGRRRPAAAAFRFRLDDEGFGPALLEWGVRMRCRILRMPYGDQGLLMSARLYNEIGGYKPIPLFEDVDVIRRLGWRRIKLLRSSAITSAHRYKRDGYLCRSLRNWGCLAMYRVGVPIERIAAFYK